MALKNVVADGGLAADFNGAGAVLLAAADHFAWILQDAQVAPFALQLVHACAAAGAGIVLAGVGGNPASRLVGIERSRLTDAATFDEEEEEEEEGLPGPSDDPPRPCFREDFACLDRLGRGAFGEVWHCRDHGDGKEYAVKAVRYRASGPGRDAERRACREVQMLSSMRHPNILRYIRSWVEVDQNSCGVAGRHGRGPAASRACGASPEPAGSPPPPSPSFKTVLPTPSECGSEGTDDRSCSYDGGSCGSAGVVFEGSRSGGSREEASAPTPRGSGLPSLAGADRHRYISSGWSASSAEGVRDKPTRREAEDDSESGLRRPERAAPEDIDGDGSSKPSDYTATLFIQVELCQEETLQGWIASRNAKAAGPAGKQIARDALRILAQCARALAHLHGRSCVHRDVKPSNILFAQDGSIRLGDFGLAKALERRGDAPQVQGERRRARTLGRVVGTPSYASPEQRTGASAGFASDVYSLGLVLFELICPVQTQMERVAVLDRLRESREVPDTIAASCRKLAQLAVWMTEPDPSKRPTASEILSYAQQAPEVTSPRPAAGLFRRRTASVGQGGGRGPRRRHCPRRSRNARAAQHREVLAAQA